MSQMEEIETLVREVLARLTTTAGQSSSVAQLADSQPLVPVANSTLAWSPRLLTQQALVDKLAGVQIVRVAQGTVVTPAARDLLRQHEVRLEIDGKIRATMPSQPQLVLGVAECRFSPASLMPRLKQQAVPTEQVAESGLPKVVEELADRVVHHGRVALLLTEESAAALCLANRRHGVRAALGNSTTMVSKALQSIGTNFLIVEPAGRSPFELCALASQFCAAPARQCPEAWKTHLT